jgi:hypothetical protein
MPNYFKYMSNFLFLLVPFICSLVINKCFITFLFSFLVFYFSQMLKNLDFSIFVFQRCIVSLNSLICIDGSLLDYFVYLGGSMILLLVSNYKSDFFSILTLCRFPSYAFFPFSHPFSFSWEGYNDTHL